MAVDITIPSLGESLSEGTISRWFKHDGDSVQQGEPLFELETDKATTEVPAPATGTLRVRVSEGKTVAVGATIGAIEETSTRPARVTEKPKPTPLETKSRKKETPPEEKAKEVPKKPVLSPRQTPHPSPAARRLSSEEHLKPVAIPSPSRGGAVAQEDGSAHEPKGETDGVPGPAPEPRAPEKTPADERETRHPMSAVRQRVAERLLASQKNTATLTTFNEADLSVLQALRARHQDRFREKHGVKLGLMSFFVKACVEALKAFPIVNARIDQNDVIYYHYYNIGVAVSTEKGLMVPVVRDADRLSLAQIERTIAELAEKARGGKIALQDLQGGTFTITNGGVFGSLLSTPLLNPPQSAILGLHTIQKRPVVVDDQVVVRPMMYLALSYDHRLIDGRDAVGFLLRVKDCVEDPERMLLGV